MMLLGGTLPPILCSVLFLQAPSQPPVDQTGTLVGRVVAMPDSQPVAAAVVRVNGRPQAEAVDTRGRFAVTLPPGVYGLRVEAFGFVPAELSDIRVSLGDTSRVTVVLQRRPFELALVVVTPSAFGITEERAVSAQTLTRREVEASPHMGADLFRAMNRLPGIATHDVSAKLRVRGGPDDQVLTLLDGLELYEPYHMKYWDGSLSVVDPDAVGSVELLTGGFSAEYGDRLTGVISTRSVTPPPQLKTALGLSVTNATLHSSGGFADGRGRWLFIARRGFLEYAFAVTGVDEGGDLEPSYYDVFAKTLFEVFPGHFLTAHLLHTGENLRAVEEDSTLIDGKYGSSYGWLTWNASLAPALSVETILSTGGVMGDREGEDDEGGGVNLSVREQRTLSFYGISQNWSYQVSPQLMLRWGGEFKGGDAEYSYFRRGISYRPNLEHYTGYPWGLELDRVDVTSNPAGNELSLYVSGRARVLESLTTEVGVRYDDISYTGDRTISPRLAMALELDRKTTLRGAWGHYYQPQGLHELAAVHEDLTFYPAARAEHRILGLEHRLPGGATLRVEAYQRLTRDPRPEYRNLAPEVEGLWEESLSDIVRLEPTRARAMGVEVLAKGWVGSRVAWTASYALAVSEEEIDAQWVPRPMDQRHTLTAELALRPTPSFSLSWAWIYHSPWPYTRKSFTLVPVMNSDGAAAFQTSFGPLNHERMPAYHRLDTRVTKRFDLKRGSLFVYLDVFNALNRENPLAVHTNAFWNPDLQQPEYLDRIETQLGVLPTLGLRWEF